MAIQQVSSVGQPQKTESPRPLPVRNPKPETSPAPDQRVQASPDQVERALNEVRKTVQPVAQNLQFQIDKGTGKTVITIVDASTKEVIRQIPSEELLAIAKALDRLQGVLLKQKA